MLWVKKMKQFRYRPGQAQRVPDFVTAVQDGGRLSALRIGRLYPQEIFLEIISVTGWVDRKDFMSMKNPLTPAGIKPASFRFVAQNLNHCATAVPDVLGIYSNSVIIIIFFHLIFNRDIWNREFEVSHIARWNKMHAAALHSATPC